MILDYDEIQRRYERDKYGWWFKARKQVRIGPFNTLLETSDILHMMLRHEMLPTVERILGEQETDLPVGKEDRRAA